MTIADLIVAVGDLPVWILYILLGWLAIGFLCMIFDS
jgi:hypothetical protein